MPDFAKALSQFRGPIGRACDSQGALKPQQHSEPLKILPDGVVESTPLGSHYAIREIYPHDYYHGKIRLNRFSPRELESLIALMHASCDVPQRDRILFLDTETTGMQGGAGMCPFLVGLGFFVDDEFHMLQYFIRDFDEEPSMLYALAGLLESFDMVVTYNGAAFDIPLLETRFTLARLDNGFQRLDHLDLLPVARRLWRNGHGSCRLVALERELLCFLRGPDVPGAMIPRAYFDFLQQRPGGTLRGVFNHNVHDVISLAALTLHACDRVNVEPAALDDPLDLYSLGRVLENSSDWRRSIPLYEMAIAGGLPEAAGVKALENLIVMYRRSGDQERSFRICSQLMAQSIFSMTAYEGAAIYFERVNGDLDSALRVIEEGIERLSTFPEKKRCRTLLKVRWDRLQQKVLRFVP